MDERTVVAKSVEHQTLLDRGWKPYSAVQVLEHKELHRNGHFCGHDLKPVTELMVTMRSRHG